MTGSSDSLKQLKLSMLRRPTPDRYNRGEPCPAGVFHMLRMFAPFIVVGLLAISAAVAWANRAPPDRPPEPEKKDAVVWAPVVIKADALKGDDAGAKAKIVIPRSMLPTIDEKQANAERSPAGGTIIAGIALS